eukprot:788740-Lingulodinium_polyedra.AAC.1
MARALREPVLLPEFRHSPLWRAPFGWHCGISRTSQCVGGGVGRCGKRRLRGARCPVRSNG